MDCICNSHYGSATLLPTLLGPAWLLPLASFVLIVFFGKRMGHGGKAAGYLATAAIVSGFVLSLVGLDLLAQRPSACGGARRAARSPSPAIGTRSASFGSLSLTIGYYIDSLTIAMFCMVTLVASCIHVYSLGYMHEELHEVTDPLATLDNGEPLRRRGRFYRFFQYLSLFCFSMLGLVIAGNLAMVFAFWELVGICSYLLIGFYIERKSASNAANKAFIVNRVGDFGMIIGLMAIFAGMGTFSFGDYRRTPTATRQPGIFSQVRPAAEHHEPQVPDGMVAACRRGRKWPRSWRTAATRSPRDRPQSEVQRAEAWREQGYGYWLLVVAGLGIFCGCVGKSAQFPLHVWLPDAMEGPTPVSALIHAATMVAAGVYLVGRCLSDLHARGAAGHRHRRHDHALHRRHDRHHGHRHQARAGLFDRQPVGLHDAGPGRWAAGWPACSTCSRTPSSRPCCSSAPAR